MAGCPNDYPGASSFERIDLDLTTFFSRRSPPLLGLIERTVRRRSCQADGYSAHHLELRRTLSAGRPPGFLSVTDPKPAPLAVPYQWAGYLFRKTSGDLHRFYDGRGAGTLPPPDLGSDCPRRRHTQ